VNAYTDKTIQVLNTRMSQNLLKSVKYTITKWRHCNKEGFRQQRRV